MNKKEDTKIRLKYNIGFEKYKCPKCSKKFRIKQAYLSHIREHNLWRNQ